MAKWAPSNKGPFRMRRGKGVEAWGPEEHERHKKGMRPSRKGSRMSKQIRRGGLD